MKTLRTLVTFLLVLCLLPLSAMAEEEAAPNRYTYMVAYNSTWGDANDMFFFQNIEEKFHIDLDITVVSEEGWEEKKNLAFATDDLPDIMTGLSASDLGTYGSQGMLRALNDFLTSEITPTILSAFEKKSDLKRAHYFPDGNIYAIWGFNFIEREIPSKRFWLNRAWAEKLGVKVPETLDEYYDYLVAVRDGDADGDGDLSNEIPLSGRYSVTTYNSSESNYQILSAFGFLCRDIQVTDGVAGYNAVQDNYREYLRFMNRLYTEKLLDPEYFTQSDEQLIAKFATADVASFTCDAQWLFGEMTDEAVYSNWTGIIPLTSQYNATPIWGGTPCLVLRNIAITHNVEDPAELMGIFDWLYTIEGYNANWNGPELGEWDKHPDWGWYYENDDASGQRKFSYSEEYETVNEYIHAVCSPWTFPCSQWSGDPSTDALDNNLTENMVKYYVPYCAAAFPANAHFTVEESEEMSLLRTDIENYFYEMEAKMITGEYDIDGTWDTFVAGMRDRGVGRLVEIYQTAYDRYMAN